MSKHLINVTNKMKEYIFENNILLQVFSFNFGSLQRTMCIVHCFLLSATTPGIGRCKYSSRYEPAGCPGFNIKRWI